jgi:hypothetical protein
MFHQLEIEECRQHPLFLTLEKLKGKKFTNNRCDLDKTVNVLYCNRTGAIKPGTAALAITADAIVTLGVVK